MLGTGRAGGGIRTFNGSQGGQTMMRTRRWIFTATALAALVGAASTAHAVSSATRQCIAASRATRKGCVTQCGQDYKASFVNCFGPGANCAAKCVGEQAQCAQEPAQAQTACQADCTAALRSALQTCDGDVACASTARVQSLSCNQTCQLAAAPFLQTCNAGMQDCIQACASRAID
jgi:hypothetical protein